ncbi:hypothetical protein H0H87_010718 [Tephrocybe sp. NHM501043]|nr:hypothetical protein H0H87_010718 [Tephrocybe sp. NHM501043]
MSSTTSPPFDHPSRPHSPRNQDDVRQLVSSAFSVIEQTPPPSLREILTAYRNKGDGDRDMLLAMLSAKTAEDQVKPLCTRSVQTTDMFSSSVLPP